MSFSSDDSSPTSSLPSSPSTSATSAPALPGASEYRAPLSGEAPEPSIDGTSVGGGEGGIRAATVDDVGEAEKKLALSLKSQANAHFTQSRYREALDLYTASLNKDPFSAVVWSNRAAVRLKLEEHGLAIADATRAIELDARAVKAYYRRAIANLAILKPKAAIVDLKKVISLEPNNAAAKAQLDATQKLVRRLAFESAIAGKEEEPMSATVQKQLDDGTAPIPSDYDGPRLDKDERPTAQFVDDMISHFKDGKLLPKRIAWQILLGAYEILKEEESMVDVSIPEGQTVDVIGDVHGQFYDFMHLLSLTGKPSATHSLVFNGDLVDRGSWSVEILLTVFAYKWLYPSNVFINRGNHETSDMNRVYGYEGEATKKYGAQMFKLSEEVFTALPLSALITASQPPRVDASPNPPNPTLYKGAKRFFVVHGGLFSNDDVTLDDVRGIPRMKLKQPGQEGLMCEMLWTDPQTEDGRGPSKRGVGLGFGPDITRRWTEKNEVTAVIRAHEVRQGGYSVEHGGLLITVFSAPNYVDQVGNLAAFARIDDSGEIKFTTFEAQPHPNHIRPMMYAGSMGMGMM
ncbi:PP5 family serine/threonine-protein phosphatase [Rhodotorula paludigena]|uniref:PP5 family serine/threonine-protein phosphatase n=1 Tax=Rhodotorula paludigena TaxID=86838 RepID=UPI00317C1CB0